MLIIGLTGGIGSGKSVVSNMFSEMGVPVLDADIASREIVMPGKPALVEIRLHFGDEVINQDGELDRAALRKIVFTDADELQWLEQLTHPLIRERLVSQLEVLEAPYAILVSPLLFETDQYELADRILVVDVSEELQLQRASARDNNDPEQILRIMASQADRGTRNSRADDVILNDGSIDDLRARVSQLHQSYLKLSKSQ